MHKCGDGERASILPVTSIVFRVDVVTRDSFYGAPSKRAARSSLW